MSFFFTLAHQNPANGESDRSRSVWIARAGDVDEFQKSVKGYRLELSQLDCGRFTAHAVQTQLGRAVLSAARYGRVLVGMEHDQAETLRAMLDTLFNEAVRNPFHERAAMWALGKQEDLLRVLLQFTGGHSLAIRAASSTERARVLKAARTLAIKSHRVSGDDRGPALLAGPVAGANWSPGPSIGTPSSEKREIVPSLSVMNSCRATLQGQTLTLNRRRIQFHRVRRVMEMSDHEILETY
jgi:hypothetical protein